MSAKFLRTLPRIDRARAAVRRTAKPGEALRKVKPGDLFANDPEVMETFALQILAFARALT
jgi:hypothetical protein